MYVYMCMCVYVWVSETPWVRILLSAEEDNLSPFDSKIACLCQSIEINNNKYVYRQSQVRMPNGSGVRWAECLLIIGMGCRVQVFAWSSIAQSVCQQAFSLPKIGFQRPLGFESCSQQRKTTCLLSIRKSLACARASKLTTTNIYVYMCAYICVMCMYTYMFMYIYASLGFNESNTSDSQNSAAIIEYTARARRQRTMHRDLTRDAPRLMAVKIGEPWSVSSGKPRLHNRDFRESAVYH